MEASIKKSRREGWQGMNWIRQEKRLAIYIRDNFICQHCQLDLKLHAGKESGIRIELDHLQPVSQGGKNEAENLVTSCNKCNASRGATALVVFHSLPYAIDLVAQARKPINIALAKQILAEKKSAKKEVE